jgi:hypothetical protein
MNALLYLTRKQIKNFFLDLLHHPGRLIAYLFIAVMIVLSLIESQTGEQKSSDQFADLRILNGIFLAWFLFLSVVSLLASLKSGTTMFKMSDVNFLFVSPIPPKRIQSYGLLKQTASTLLAFVFLLCYSGTLMDHFNVGFSAIVAFLVYSVVLMVVMQVLSLLVYSYSNGNPKRKNIVRAALYGYLSLMLLTALAVARANGSGLESLLAAISSPYLEYFPIVGWAQGAVFGVIHHNTAALIIYTVLLAVSFVLLLLLFRKSDSDYYEDVLQTTETQFEARQAQKENRPVTVTMRNDAKKKVRVGRTGFGGGWGASTFFFKHLCEARRQSRLIFINTFTFILIAVDLVLIYAVPNFVGSDADIPLTPNRLMMITFMVDLYALYLMNAAGDWSRELEKPYIYLVPANPFRKLLWASMTSVIKPIIDGAVLSFVSALAARANPLTALAFFLAYGSFGLLFLSGNILSQRTMGSMSNRGLAVVLFMVLLLVLMAPGIALSVVAYIFLQAGGGAAILLISALPMIGWNVLVALVVIYLCRNLLSNTEFNN